LWCSGCGKTPTA
jgi:hypothetical protein